MNRRIKIIQITEADRERMRDTFIFGSTMLALRLQHFKFSALRQKGRVKEIESKIKTFRDYPEKLFFNEDSIRR